MAPVACRQTWTRPRARSASNQSVDAKSPGRGGVSRPQPVQAGKGDPVSVNIASLRVNGVISVVYFVAVVAAVAAPRLARLG